MKLLPKITLLFLCPFFAIAQSGQKQLDSLNTALKRAENDTVKMIVLYSLSNYYSESNWDSALLVTEQALGISKKFKQPLWTANLLLNKSYFLGKQGNLPLAFKLTNEALTIAQDEKNEKNVFIEKGDVSAGNPHKYRLFVLAGVYHILGNQYAQADKEKAITYYKEEIRISEEIEKGLGGLMVNSNMNIGGIFFEMGKLDSAQIYLSRAWAYANNTGYKTYEGYIIQGLADIYFKRKQLDSAKQYYWQALNASNVQNNLAAEASTNISLAKLYESVQQADSILYYAKNALRIATNLNELYTVVKSSKLISGAYKMLGITDSAFAYLSISITLGDSLNADKNEKLMQFQNISFEEQQRLEKEAQQNKDAKTKLTTIALFTGIGLVSVLAIVFYRNTRQKQKANKILEETMANLKATQAQLIQSEKMASLGELTAGIAHEIQNPLNFVNNFSEVNGELISELVEEVDKGNTEEVKAIAGDIKENEEKINHHGKRADAIVKGMLQHSRTSSGQKEPTDINALCDEYLRLAYHGIRAKDKDFKADIKTEFDESIGKINAVPQDIGRVLLNLFNNAFYAVNEKKQKLNGTFEPVVSVSTNKENGNVVIRVADNGNGVPQKIIDKIFQPFFTTKPTGQGTGLGLSLSYDIIKAHGGEVKINTKEGEKTEFIIQLSV